MSRKPAQSVFPSRLAAFHRWAGFAACAFVLVISVTGLLLNHSVALSLDRKFIAWPWLLEWYGLSPEGEPVAYSVDGRWIVGWGGEAFLDGRQIARDRELTGAGRLGDELVVVFPRAVLVLDARGDLIEEWAEPILPDRDIQRAGTIAGSRLVIETANGRYLVVDGRSVPASADHAPDWFETAPLPSLERKRAQQAFGGEGLPVYRVLLDLHSGKFFRTLGVVVYDAAAVIFVLLAISGIWLGVARRGRPRNYQ